VRDCYPKLFDKVKKFFDARAKAMDSPAGIEKDPEELPLAGVFIYGNPGIGKSVFLDYALHRYLELGKPVLFLSGPDSRAYLYRPSVDERRKN